MKKVILGVGLLFGIGVGMFYGTNASAMQVDLDNFLLRAYNPNTGEHFFTTSYPEADWLTTQGWIAEGTAWSLPDKGDIVYRLYNQNAGDHFYTKNVAEYDWLATQGWLKEGESFLSDTKDDVPVYRSYNQNAIAAGSHMFTTDKSEQDGLVDAGWINENIQFYAESTYSRLEKRINYCDDNIKEADYAASDYAEFQITLDSVKTILNNSSSTKEDFNKASDDLYTALGKLYDSKNVDE